MLPGLLLSSHYVSNPNTSNSGEKMTTKLSNLATMIIDTSPTSEIPEPLNTLPKHKETQDK